MATIQRNGQQIHTLGSLPEVGAKLAGFTLTGTDMNDFGLEVAAGQALVLNIFPSIDTSVCAMSVRRFNELAAGLPDTLVLCVSADLPMAQARFCGAEGIDRVVMGSTFRSSFGSDYQVTLVDGSLRGLLSRAVLVAGPDLIIRHAEQVPVLGQEPDYDAALAALG